MKILVVDDEEEIVELLTFFIRDKGHEVDVAYNGQAGLETLLKNRYDLVFLDHNMPELTGIEVLKFIHQQKVKVKTVIMSGYEGMNRHFARVEGADEYLSKPFSAKTVTDILDRLLDS